MIGALGAVFVAFAVFAPLMQVAWKMTTPPPARRMFREEDR